MPSFDVVSEVDMHELSNAVDQANREVTTRFDFKGTDAKFEQKGPELTLSAGGEFQLQQMMDILQKKMVKRGVDIASLDVGKPETTNMVARQKVTVREGIDKEAAKKIVKIIKEGKMKVQAAISLWFYKTIIERSYFFSTSKFVKEMLKLNADKKLYS